MKIILAFLICISANLCAFAQDNFITVYAGKPKAQINRKVFGNNSLGHAGKQSADFGWGIWDGKWNESVKEVISLAKEAGITVLRFPGGCGAHCYNWKAGVGEKREHFLFGIEEFLQTCAETGAEPVFTVSYFEGNEQDAADLVRYTRGRIKYFEIGNEDWHGDHNDIKQVLPEEYAERYIRYYAAMKAAEPAVKIGVILNNKDWNEKVLSAIKGNLDFGIVHIYPTPAWGENLKKFTAKEIFAVTLALPEIKYQAYLKDTLDTLEKYAGRKVPLAVTEFNGGFAQEKPVPYRHTLLCALVNAELLKVFMRPENNILTANYWNFVNEYWGMIANGFNGKYETLNKPYYKRPNYYVFEMYHRHFGEILLEAQVISDGYDAGRYASLKALTAGMDSRVPYLSVNAGKSRDGNSVYLMVINKNMDEPIAAAIDLPDFAPAPKGRAWVLNGPAVDATNEARHNNVRVKETEFEIKTVPFEWTFEPHSLTAIELTRRVKQ